MNLDCRWFDNKLEPFLNESLPADEHRAAHVHLANCGACRQTVEGLRSIDPLIKRVFQQDLATARLPRRRRSAAVVGVFATATVSLVLLIVLLTPQRFSEVRPAQNGPQSAAINPLDSPAVPKMDENAAADRAKPENAVDRSAAPAQPSNPPSQRSAPDFLITDPAGYSRSLADYRGSVLLFGVFGPDQPQVVANLQRVYETFGKNTRLRIVGVTSQHVAKPAGATFTMAYNEGSALLGASPSQFIIVDDAGKVRYRGSLQESEAAVLAAVRTALAPFDFH
jgi:hypothetical protein